MLRSVQSHTLALAQIHDPSPDLGYTVVKEDREVIAKPMGKGFHKKSGFECGRSTRIRIVCNRILIGYCTKGNASVGRHHLKSIVPSFLENEL